MPNPAIPRDIVHASSEACGADPLAFQPIATRLIKEQRRLSRFVEESAQALGNLETQVVIYMLSVCLRVFEQRGGRMKKVSQADIDAALRRIQGVVPQLLPADGAFAERAKAIGWRAQPHLLDEVLWALYERGEADKKPGEVDLDPGKSALVYLALWAAVEAMDANWSAPAA